MNLKKFSMLIFMLGVLISVFSGAFPIVDSMRHTKIIVLLVLGIIVGLLNVSEDQQRNFLIAGIAFILGTQAILNVMNHLFLLSSIGIMLTNLVIFIAPALVVIALKEIFAFASESDININFEKALHEKEKHIIEKIWDIILLVAVSLVFVLLILESFYQVASYEIYFNILNNIVNVIFIVDVFVLLKKSESLGAFFKRNWIDIIAAVPLGSVFKLLKLVRTVRIIKFLSQISKVAKTSGTAAKITKTSSAILKSNSSLKFFSSNSGFNKYVVDPKKKAKKRKGKKLSTSKKIKKSNKLTSKK